MVSMPSLRLSSIPVDSGRARASNRRSSGRSPYRSMAMSWMAVAARTFQSAVRACPSVSMHVQTTAAPNSLARVRNESSRVPGSSPSSRLTELITARPPIHDRAVSTTGASVESTIRGAVDWVAKREATSSMSATPSAPV